MILATLFLAACGSPAAGTSITIGPGAQGCQTWNSSIGEWADCSAGFDGLGGTVEAHPTLGQQYAGRVRVKIGGQAFWFLPGDLITH